MFPSAFLAYGFSKELNPTLTSEIIRWTSLNRNKKTKKQNCTMLFNDKIVPTHYATKAYLGHRDKKIRYKIKVKT